MPELTPDQIPPGKLWRFTVLDERHNGFQYQTGENVDTVEFNPNGHCQPGGLYFMHEDDLRGLGRSLPLKPVAWVRQVTVPTNARVYKEVNFLFTGVFNKYKADRLILSERIPFTEFIADKPNPVANADLIDWACASKDVETVKCLHSTCGVPFTSLAISIAVEYDLVDVVSLVLAGKQFVSPQRRMMEIAAQWNRLEIAKMILKCSDEMSPEVFQEALTMATRWKSYDVAELLADLGVPVNCHHVTNVLHHSKTAIHLLKTRNVTLSRDNVTELIVQVNELWLRGSYTGEECDEVMELFRMRSRAQ